MRLDGRGPIGRVSMEAVEELLLDPARRRQLMCEGYAAPRKAAGGAALTSRRGLPSAGRR